MVVFVRKIITWIYKKNGFSVNRIVYCLVPYHESCQTYEDIDEVFMSDTCWQLEYDLEKEIKLIKRCYYYYNIKFFL